MKKKAASPNCTTLLLLEMEYIYRVPCSLCSSIHISNGKNIDLDEYDRDCIRPLRLTNKRARGLARYLMTLSQWHATMNRITDKKLSRILMIMEK